MKANFKILEIYISGLGRTFDRIAIEAYEAELDKFSCKQLITKIERLSDGIIFSEDDVIQQKDGSQYTIKAMGDNNSKYYYVYTAPNENMMQNMIYIEDDTILVKPEDIKLKKKEPTPVVDPEYRAFDEALILFKESEGYEADMNNRKHEAAISAIQLGILGTYRKYKID